MKKTTQSKWTTPAPQRQKGISIPKPPRSYRVQRMTAAQPVTQTLRILTVTNNLPYGCIVEVEVSAQVDAIYYALQESRDSTRKLLFNSANAPTTSVSSSSTAKRKITLPAFSIHDFTYTNQSELWLVCWPVHRTATGEDEIGAAVYYYPIHNYRDQSLGGYELEVDFQGADLTLFRQIKPLLEKHFGKAALPGKVQVQYSNRDVYLPQTNTIYLSADKRNLIHELLHANRKHLLFASEGYRFDEKTEMIEEAFAEGVSNMIKDELNKQPNTLLEPGAVYGSTLGYNYDFRIQEEALITQNLQSTTGGIRNLENSRYFLGSEAFHKIALEYYMQTGRYFGKEYNDLYYQHIERTKINPDKELFYTLCERLMPTIEQTPCREWLDRQRLFRSEIIPGDKLFLYLVDYQLHDQWIGMCYINFYETFRNGSDWRYGDSRIYRKNGSPVDVKITQVSSGKVCFQKRLKIPEYPGGFGTIKIFLHHQPIDQGLDYFLDQDDALQIPYETAAVETGLYRVELSTARVQKTYYRFMGDSMYAYRDQLLVGIPLPDNRNRTLQVVHENKKGYKTYLGGQRFSGQYCRFVAPFIKDGNCEPGILSFTLSEYGQTRTFQRTIGYGGEYGGHQFWLHELEQDRRYEV